MRKLTDQQRNDACTRYIAGENGNAIAGFYGVNPSSITRLLAKRGVNRRSPRDARQHYKIDKGFFQALDTEQKAYWLGFLFADGSVSDKTGKSLVRVGLTAKDINHLENLRGALATDVPIYTWTTKSGKPCASLTLCCREMTDSLQAYGLGVGKARTFSFPDLPDHLVRHFVRGYIDGDGCFHCKPHKTDRYLVCRMHVIANKAFLENLQIILAKFCDLNLTKFRPTLSADFFVLQYGGRRQVARIASYLYEGATIWLPRKREIAERAL